MSDKYIDLNRIPLNGDDFNLYFQKLFLTFEILKVVYNSIDTKESEIIFTNLRKLENTFKALRFKYMYSIDDDKKLKIDKTDSGFPNFYEIDSLMVDLKNLNELKLDAKKLNLLKEELLNELLSKDGSDINFLLSDLSFSSYINHISEEDLFLSFNEGLLEEIDSSSDKNLSYSYFWSTYDVSTSMPYIYIMTFECSKEDDLTLIVDALKKVANRAPNLNIVAASIDEKLINIHPKILKRIAIGPFYSSKFAEDLNDDITKIFTYGDEGKKFLLFIEDEFVYAHKEVISNNFLSKDTVRQLFYVPSHKLELYDKGVSDVTKKVILPYKLHQHIKGIIDIDTIYSFDNEGEIHGIK